MTPFNFFCPPRRPCPSTRLPLPRHFFSFQKLDAVWPSQQTDSLDPDPGFPNIRRGPRLQATFVPLGGGGPFPPLVFRGPISIAFRSPLFHPGKVYRGRSLSIPFFLIVQAVHGFILALITTTLYFLFLLSAFIGPVKFRVFFPSDVGVLDHSLLFAPLP